MKKNKKNYTTHTVEAFNIHVSEDNMIIETRAKDWQLTVGNMTKEYGVMSYYIAENAMDLVELFCQALQTVRLIFSDATLIWDIISISDKYLANQEYTEAENDDEILLEEKVLQEKNIQAINEHIEHGKK